jgi:hypothetical protein
VAGKDSAGTEGGAGAGGWAAALALFFGAAFFAAPCPEAALRSTFWRFRRAFFFTCDLRRFIFIELRLSCFPTGAPCPRGARRVNRSLASAGGAR